MSNVNLTQVQFNKLINAFKSRQTALGASAGMILAYQTPKTVQAFQVIGASLYDGVAYSIFFELIMLYFVFNGLKWHTLLSVIGDDDCKLYAVFRARDSTRYYIGIGTPVIIWSVG